MEKESQQINERLLRITGSAFLENDIDMDNRFKFEGECEPYSREEKDRQDGSYDIIYKAKFCGLLNVEQGGKKILAKDRTSKSRRLKGAIWYLGQEQGVDDDNIFYEVVMDKILVNLPEIWEIIKSR